MKTATEEMVKTWKTEMQELARRHRGVLNPPEVVAFARDPKTALHSMFEWNDKRASHAYRLWQARQLIVQVQVIIPEHTSPVQAFVSLTTDRAERKGYRETVRVLSDQELRRQLLWDALVELQRWQEKYRHLSELDAIFAAADRVRSSNEAAG